MTSASDLSACAVDVAREAGKQIMASLPLGRWREDIQQKAGRELVSRVDRESEALIVRRILSEFPDHGIMAEEGSSHGDEDSSHRWVIDPLDGTTNFLHGLPIFAVSLAAQERGDDGFATQAAVVHLPYLGEMFVAEKGGGAWLNSQSIQLRASTCENLAEALVVTGFSYDRERYPNYDRFVRVARAAGGIRRTGAAAADLAWVAAGRFDAYWELGLQPWDVAAGALLVSEAGGEVSDIAGGNAWHSGESIVAGSPKLVGVLRALVADP